MKFKEGDLVEASSNLNFSYFGVVVPKGTKGIIRGISTDPVKLFLDGEYSVEWLDFESDNAEFNKGNKIYACYVESNHLKLIRRHIEVPF